MKRTAIFLIALCAGCESVLGLRATSFDPDAGEAIGTVGPGDEWAHWPMPNPPATGLPNPESYDASTPDVVVDNMTGLMWQRRVDVNFFPWNEAQAYCAGLVLAGYDDWRLPSRLELLSILDFAQGPNVAAIDPAAFPNTPLDEFWTSSAYAEPSDLYDFWYVVFAQQGATFPALVGKPYRVRCVRAPTDVVRHAGPALHYVVRAQTVFDSQTGLTWQQSVGPGELAWSDAVAYCASLTLEGGRWRLPSVKELATVIDEKRLNPAIEPTAFPSAPTNYFWTSSFSESNPDHQYWFIYFGSGWTGQTTPVPMSVRCVR